MLMLKAYAKINLGLKILSKDEVDGYHLVDMVTLPIELHDRIEIEVLPDNFDTIITCDDRSLPTDESNIVYKTLKVLNEKHPINKKLRIHIHKIIPVCAGLGGGSADAAAVLIGLNKLLKLKMSQEELCELGSKVGSDVPLCILNKPARVSSKGEKVEVIKTKKTHKVLLVKPSIGLSTREVYLKYDEEKEESLVNIDGVVEGLIKGDNQMVFDNMGNDLEKPAFSIAYETKNIKDLLKKNGFDNVLMTGSGSCVYAIIPKDKKTENIENKLKKMGYTVFVTKTLI
ncbi:MAG: 4-(cytidine 5'-diphospho)-2-C-methyl-D-erythritol kinase [Erysipelotrichaceae bacterium]|nr:4-(cytidine 5'-diphospho)-2-C-methyl-D-erythritol kinase [Erysipelotrichaceae bacterium]